MCTTTNSFCFSLADDKDMSVGEIWKSIWNEFTPGIDNKQHLHRYNIFNEIVMKSFFSCCFQTFLLFSYVFNNSV